jgi:hypothetical protein
LLRSPASWHDSETHANDVLIARCAWGGPAGVFMSVVLVFAWLRSLFTSAERATRPLSHQQEVAGTSLSPWNAMTPGSA